MKKCVFYLMFKLRERRNRRRVRLGHRAGGGSGYGVQSRTTPLAMECPQKLDPAQDHVSTVVDSWPAFGVGVYREKQVHEGFSVYPVCWNSQPPETAVLYVSERGKTLPLLEAHGSLPDVYVTCCLCLCSSLLHSGFLLSDLLHFSLLHSSLMHSSLLHSILLQALDAVYFNGVNKDGMCFIMRIGRRHQREAEIWLSIRVPGVGFYQSPTHPDTAVYNTDGKGFNVAGLRFECLEVHKKWKITYNGVLRWVPSTRMDLPHPRNKPFPYTFYDRCACAEAVHCANGTISWVFRCTMTVLVDVTVTTIWWMSLNDV